MSINNWTQVRVPSRTRLLSISWVTADMVAWQNKPFKPKEGDPWLRETILPASETITANKELTGLGIIQYDYFMPIGGSISDAELRAKDIKDAFKAGSAIDQLWIERSEVLTGDKDQPDGAWYQIPVHIYYRAFTTNP